MFCSNCGKELDENAKFCPNCGEKIQSNIVDDVADAVKDATDSVFKTFTNAEAELEKAAKDVTATLQGDYAEVLQSDRSLFTYVLLSFITCGIYSWYFIYKMAHDINIACEGDGEDTSGLVAFIILSVITCGIYALWWKYKLANRLAANAPKYGMFFPEAGGAVLLWSLLGAWACCLGPFVSMHILIKNSNKICHAYNVEHGYED